MKRSVSQARRRSTQQIHSTCGAARSHEEARSNLANQLGNAPAPIRRTRGGRPAGPGSAAAGFLDGWSPHLNGTVSMTAVLRTRLMKAGVYGSAGAGVLAALV